MLNCARIIIDRKTMRARNRCFSLRHRRAFGEESGRRRQGEHDSCVCRRTKEIDRVCVGEFCVYVLNTVSEYNCVAFNSKGIGFFPRLFLKNISSMHTCHYFQIPIHSNALCDTYVSRTQCCIITTRSVLPLLFPPSLLFFLLLLLLEKRIVVPYTVDFLVSNCTSLNQY